MSFIRELGAAERIYCREQTDYGNQTLVQVLIISKERKIDPLKARQALITLYQDYCSILGYQICSSDDRTTLVFKSKDPQQVEEDLMSHFQYQQNTDWHTVFENELNTPFDNENLTRWILIDGYILIMSIHHVLLDAKNFYSLARQYLSLCFTGSDKLQPMIHLPPMEKYLFDRYTYETISDLDLKPRSVRPNPIVSRTNLRHWSLSPLILARLIDQCHLHHIRLNSILSTICATAYYLTCDDEEKEKTMKIHMMVNIRPQLNLDFEQIGMFATVFDCFIPINQQTISSLWSTAARQHEDLHQRILAKEYIINCRNDTDLLKLINNNETFSCDDVQFAFSNLGVLPNTMNNEIEEHYFSVSLIEQRWTSSIFVGISTIQTHLCLTIGYNENQIEKTFIEKWIEKIDYIFEQV